MLVVAVAIVGGGIGIWLSRPRNLLWLQFWRERLRVRARVRRVALADGEVVYLKAGRGSGVPVLYVHGFTGMKENWLALMAGMGRVQVQYAPDLPGWGDSERRAGLDYGYAAQAERLVQFIDRVIGGPVDLVGHSMGGGIAAVLAARHPDKVRRLVLLDAAGVRALSGARARPPAPDAASAGALDGSSAHRRCRIRTGRAGPHRTWAGCLPARARSARDHHADLALVVP